MEHGGKNDLMQERKENKEMLLRIIGEESENTFHVVTIYKTSKIEKYWKEDLK